MKIKTIAKALACATALSVAVSSSAFAAAPEMTASRAGSNVTVNYSGISGQMTLLAFDITEAYKLLTGGAGAEDTAYEDQEIVYVTQEDAGTSKTFTVKDGWAPAEGSEAKYLLVKVGGTDIDTPAAQVVAFDYQAGEQFMYGDVDGSGQIDMSDVNEIINYTNGLADWAEQSMSWYAADVDGSGQIDMSDANQIINLTNGVIDKVDADEDGDGYGTFTGTAAASIEEPEEVVEPEDNAEVVEPEEATEPEAETPAEDAEEVKSEEVTEEVENSEEAAEETSEEETEVEVEAEADAE